MSEENLIPISSVSIPIDGLIEDVEDLTSEDFVLVVQDDEGNEVTMYVVDTLELEGKTYVLVSQDNPDEIDEDDESETEMVLFRLEEDDLVSVDSEEEFAKVVDYINSLTEEA